MIVGLGTDIEEVRRLRDLLERWGDRFLVRLFRPDEIAYCQSRTDPAMHLAGRFAAKEAFAKALGTGWNEGFRWRDVEVTRDTLGKPALRLHGRAAQRCLSLRPHLSLSHTATLVSAVVILETQD